MVSKPYHLYVSSPYVRSVARVKSIIERVYAHTRSSQETTRSGKRMNERECECWMMMATMAMRARGGGRTAHRRGVCAGGAARRATIESVRRRATRRIRWRSEARGARRGAGGVEARTNDRARSVRSSESRRRAAGRWRNGVDPMIRSRPRR